MLLRRKPEGTPTPSESPVGPRRREVAGCGADWPDSGCEETSGPGAAHHVESDNRLERTGAFQTGYLRSVGYSGRGGGENYGYYLSLGWNDEEATLPNNTLDRRTGRVNFTFAPRSDLRFDAGIGILRNESTFPINDNNICGFFLLFRWRPARPSLQRDGERAGRDGRPILHPSA